MRSSFKNVFFLTAILAAVAGCSTVNENSLQDIEVLTPGAAGANCIMVTGDKYRYRVTPPQTVKVQRSVDPLEIDCRAPGNRLAKASAEAKINRSFYTNIITGVIPGVFVDTQTGAAFQYPEQIVVDFTGVPVRPMPLPSYQYVLDNAPPDSTGVESFEPGKSLLRSDIGQPDYKLQKIDRNYRSQAPSSSAAQSAGSNEPAQGSDLPLFTK